MHKQNQQDLKSKERGQKEEEEWIFIRQVSLKMYKLMTGHRNVHKVVREHRDRFNLRIKVFG